MVVINLSDSIYSTCAIRFFILYFHQLVNKIIRLRSNKFPILFTICRNQGKKNCHQVHNRLIPLVF